MMAKYLCLLAILFNLISCTNWPRKATGGYAQHYIFTPAYQKELRKCPSLYVLSQKLCSLNKRTNGLYKGHASKCYPARIVALREIQYRTAQEIANGQVLGAKTDLFLYEKNIDALYALNKGKGCRRPPKNSYWDYLKARM